MNTNYENMPLGRLSKVNPRDIWKDEARHFTPWLAEPENLSLLSESLGIELELEAVEENVGPFRADILCREVGTDHWILIENQLEKTDHLHLGQLLTYAAGLQAVTIVWISPNFTDEHKACLDWLNSKTVDGLNLFGIQIEVWKIGESAQAPKFNIVCQPNAWMDQITIAKSNLATSETNQIHLQFWQEFSKLEKSQRGLFKAVTPAAQNWMFCSPFNRGGFIITAANNQMQGQLRVGMYLTLKTAPELFKSLKQHADYINDKLPGIEWHDSANQERAIRFVRKFENTRDPRDWPEQQQWMIDKCYEIVDVLQPIIPKI